MTWMKMMRKVTVFFRNDDVRNKLDDSLIELTDLLTENKIPIIHAVEPANITGEVVDWLINTKMNMPGLVEIIQHGYDHKIKNINPKGEFGRDRNYDEQYLDIRTGQDLMNKYFKNLWFNAFSFPYGTYSQDTISILNDLSFSVISTGSSDNFKRTVLNHVGRAIKKKFLFNKQIVYFSEFVPETKIIEVPTTINTLKMKKGDDKVVLKNSEDLINLFLKNKYRTLGFLFHHRFINKKDINELEKLLLYLKGENVRFSTFKDIYDEKVDINKRPQLAQ